MPTDVRLSDKYELPAGRVYMTGTQALVRLLFAQQARDARDGLNTAGFVSGYRGSPLGAVDQELWKAKTHLAQHRITFQPGLNEELAATAVWGSQMVNLDPNAQVDGVFALWYGKGPGVDRSGDVFKHGNIAGCSKHGGVLLIAGDDHACKSSSLPHQSEHAFIAAMIPVLNPSGVREFIEFGLHGYAMSRYSGCWVGFKAISDTIESSSSFEIDPMAVAKPPTCGRQIRRGRRVGEGAQERHPAVAKRRADASGDCQRHRGPARQSLWRRAPERAGARAAGRMPGAGGLHPRGGRQRPARAVFLLGLPAQHVDPGARRLARRRRHRLPLHGDVDGPQHRDLHANGRRGRVVDRPGAVHVDKAHLCESG